MEICKHLMRNKLIRYPLNLRISYSIYNNNNINNNKNFDNNIIHKSLLYRQQCNTSNTTYTSSVFYSNTSSVFNSNTSSVFNSNTSLVFNSNTSSVFNNNTSSVFNSNTSSVFLAAEHLTDRRLLRISGVDDDPYDFIQGLVTNDVRLLRDSPNDNIQYNMLLNSQGRVLYDLMLYKVNDLSSKDNPKSLLIECDSSIANDLISLLNKYRLRRKLEMFLLEEAIWAVFKKNKSDSNRNSNSKNDDNVGDGYLKSQIKFKSKDNPIFLANDPRIPYTFCRMILPKNITAHNVLEGCEMVSNEYTKRRYSVGLSEGVIDLPPSQALPLECNLNFLNGVSFNKGCYLGQELTARTHHTGVIRKRLMPLISSQEITTTSQNATIADEKSGKVCGKVRNFAGNYGLALIRLQDVAISINDNATVEKDNSLNYRDEILTEEKYKNSMESNNLTIYKGDLNIGRARTFIPSWWPRDQDEIVRQALTKVEEKNEDK